MENKHRFPAGLRFDLLTHATKCNVYERINSQLQVYFGITDDINLMLEQRYRE